MKIFSKFAILLSFFLYWSTANAFIFEINTTSYGDNYSSFIAALRNVFVNNRGGEATITIRPNQSSTRLSIGIRLSDLYVISINGTNIQNVRYQERSMAINPGSINHAYQLGLRYAAQSQDNQYYVMATMAFIISEATRFEVIEEQMNDLLSYHISSINRDSYLSLMRNWQIISTTLSTNITDGRLTLGLPARQNTGTSFIVGITQWLLDHFSARTGCGNR